MLPRLRNARDHPAKKTPLCMQRLAQALHVPRSLLAAHWGIKGKGRQVQACPDLGDAGEHVSEKRGVIRLRLTQLRQALSLFGNDKQMRGRLGVDVLEHERLSIAHEHRTHVASGARRLASQLRAHVCLTGRQERARPCRPQKRQSRGFPLRRSCRRWCWRPCPGVLRLHTQHDSLRRHARVVGTWWQHASAAQNTARESKRMRIWRQARDKEGPCQPAWRIVFQRPLLLQPSRADWISWCT